MRLPGIKECNYVMQRSQAYIEDIKTYHSLSTCFVWLDEQAPPPETVGKLYERSVGLYHCKGPEQLVSFLRQIHPRAVVPIINHSSLQEVFQIYMNCENCIKIFIKEEEEESLASVDTFEEEKETLLSQQ